MARSRPRKQPRGQRDMSLSYQEWRLEVGAPDHGTRLDAFLGRSLPWRSRSRLQAAIGAGSVRVLPFKDPQQAPIGSLKPGLRLRRGQEVVVRLAAAGVEDGSRIADSPADHPPVLFEDEHLLVVSKPPGWNVYPTRRHRSGSLIERVHQRHRARGGDAGYPPTLCHRLDRETSGLVLFAKSRAVRAELNEQFTARRVEKLYLALVAGELCGDNGVIRSPIGKAPGARVEIRMAVRGDGEGQPAETRWQVERRLPGRTLVALSPHTGRQHQLRVHLASIGHPIVGDKLYLGGDDLFLRWLDRRLTEEDRRLLGHPRQALHSSRLRFRHPATGSELDLEAPLWDDLVRLVRGVADDAATI